MYVFEHMVSRTVGHMSITQFPVCETLEEAESEKNRIAFTRKEIHPRCLKKWLRNRPTPSGNLHNYCDCC